MKTLEYILGALDTIAEIAAMAPGPQSPFAAEADKFIKIAQAANRAHQAATGAPIDLDLLKPVDPT